jgi:NAD(P)-dependent dehydrogenase (short-subunit alcohol dehydrogenase family)
MKLKDRIALITGGNQGIGRCIAIAFAKEGAKVVITARNENRLQTTLAELKVICVDACAFPADVGNEAQVQKLFEKIQALYGRIDILINNASITGPTKKTAEMTTAEWMEVLQINLLGTVFCCREALKLMAPAKRGAIVNIASVAGKTGRILRSPYAASKAAVINLTHTLAVEYGPLGIRVNSVCPGTTDGERIRRVFAAKAESLGITVEEAEQMRVRETPLARLIQPEEVAAVVLFLASDDAGAMTGQAVNVTCGREMR